MALALIWSLPFRLSQWIQPSWLAYALLSVVMIPCALYLLFPVKGWRRERPLWLLPLLLLATAVPRILFILRTPLEAKYGDMLPLIQLAGERFLSGSYPYGTYELPWPLPLTFFPGLWMSYLPAIALGLDPRWLALLCTLLVVGLISWRVKDLRVQLGLLLFALLPVFSFFAANGQTPPLWLWLVAFGVCFAEKRFLLSALFLGLCLASRQTMLLLFPFAALGWWRLSGWKTLFQCGALCAAVTGAFCLPFFLIDPEAFLLEPIRHYAELAAKYRESQSAHLLDTFGLATLLYQLDLAFLLGPLRLLIWGGALLGAWFFGKDSRSLLRWMAVCGMLFTMCTPIPWIYAYFPWWLLGWTAVAGATEGAAEKVSPVSAQ